MFLGILKASQQGRWVAFFSVEVWGTKLVDTLTQGCGPMDLTNESFMLKGGWLVESQGTFKMKKQF